MKTVKFAKKWRWPLSDTSHEEYPKGTSCVVSDDRAIKAATDGVLDGDPVDAPAEKLEKPAKA